MSENETVEIKKDKNPPNKLANIFALLGFFVFALLAIWSSYQVIKIVYHSNVNKITATQQEQAPQAQQQTQQSQQTQTKKLGFFESLFHREKLQIKNKSITIKHNQPFTIKWDLKTKYDGKLFFSYACIPDFYFKKPAVYNSTEKKDVKVDELNYTVIPCNAPFELPVSQDSLTLIPNLDADEKVVVKYAIAYAYTQPVKGKNLMQDIGEAVVKPVLATSKTKDTIDAMKDFLLGAPATSTLAQSPSAQDKEAKNAQQTATQNNTNQNQSPANTGAPTNTSVSQSAQTQPTIKRAPVRYVSVVVPPVNNPNGLPDLQADIISVGVIDPLTGNFVPKGTINPSERAAIKFKVKNLGDKETGPWIYKADLPTYPKFYYMSKIQPSLLPGGEATVIVSFDQLIPGRVNALIQVDPYNSIPERNETNNSDTVFFDVVTYNVY